MAIDAMEGLPITQQEFTLHCPDFIHEDVVLIAHVVDQALNYAGETEKGWGSTRRYKSAVAYCAGHLLLSYKAIMESSEGAKQNPKVVTSRTVGDVSMTWGGANLIARSMTEDQFNTSQYGYQYLQLREQRPRMIFTAF